VLGSEIRIICIYLYVYTYIEAKREQKKCEQEGVLGTGRHMNICITIYSYTRHSG